MKKVVKFGGSSLASAEQFKKVGAIISADEIEKEFGIVVGKQFNAISEMASNSGSINGSSNDRRIMSDEEYYKRYGHRRGERKNSSNVENFLMEGE